VAQILAGWWQNTADDVTSITVYNNATQGVIRVYSRGQVSIPTGASYSSSPLNMAKMVRSTTQTVPSGTETQILFNAVIFDEGNITDITNNRFVIAQDGYYMVHASWVCPGLDPGRDIWMFLYKNGSCIREIINTNGPGNNVPIGVEISTIEYFNAGDYLTLSVTQWTGSSKNTYVDYRRPSMEVIQMGVGIGSSSSVEKGKQSIKIEYKSDNEVYVNPGFADIKGTTVEIDTKTTISGSYSANTWYYVYLDSVGSITTSSGIPTIDYNNMGYYDGNNRCIGFFGTDPSSSVIYPFSIHRGNYVLEGAWDIDTAWDVIDHDGKTLTLNVPLGNLLCEAYIFGRSDSSVDVIVFAKNADKVNGKLVGESISTSYYFNNTFTITCSDNKQIVIYSDEDNTHVFRMRLHLNGFTIPDYIYTGA
jgi:hypothetical protein